MLNNKGQSLILFIVILPIMLLVLIFVVDMGRVITYKQELDNINKIAIDYGLDNLNNDNLKEELINLIKLNNNEIENINIKIKDNKLYATLNMNVDGIFCSLIKISIFDVSSSYVGYIDEDEKKIERVSR